MPSWFLSFYVQHYSVLRSPDVKESGVKIWMESYGNTNNCIRKYASPKCNHLKNALDQVYQKVTTQVKHQDHEAHLLAWLLFFEDSVGYTCPKMYMPFKRFENGDSPPIPAPLPTPPHTHTLLSLYWWYKNRKNKTIFRRWSACKT